MMKEGGDKSKKEKAQWILNELMGRRGWIWEIDEVAILGRPRNWENSSAEYILSHDSSFWDI